MTGSGSASTASSVGATATGSGSSSGSGSGTSSGSITGAGAASRSGASGRVQRGRFGARRRSSPCVGVGSCRARSWRLCSFGRCRPPSAGDVSGSSRTGAGTARSSSRSRAMTRWRSSRLLPDTRTASPWICDLTFGNSSRISLVIFLATSSDSPRRRPICWRTLLPPAGSTLPQSKILSDRLRRMAFDSMRSLTAAARCSSSVSRTSSSLDWVSSTVTPLKSNRGPDLAADLVERVAQLLLVEIADDVE